MSNFSLYLLSASSLQLSLALTSEIVHWRHSISAAAGRYSYETVVPQWSRSHTSCPGLVERVHGVSQCCERACPHIIVQRRAEYIKWVNQRHYQPYLQFSIFPKANTNNHHRICTSDFLPAIHIKFLESIISYADGHCCIYPSLKEQYTSDAGIMIHTLNCRSSREVIPYSQCGQFSLHTKAHFLHNHMVTECLIVVLTKRTK